MKQPILTPVETLIYIAARSYLYGESYQWSSLERDPYAAAPRRSRVKRRRPTAWMRAAFGRKTPAVAAGPCS